MGVGRGRVALVSPEVYAYGAMVVGGALRDAGFEVGLHRELDPNKIWGVEVVGLSLTSTLHLLDVKALVSRARLGWDPFMVVGGPVSQVPELVFKCLPEVDAVVVGEGEETTPQLLQAHTNHTPLETIPGLALKGKDEAAITTPPRAPLDLSKRPLPLIPNDIAKQSLRGVNTCIETHRGCTGACTFCQAPQFYGHTIRSRPMEEIVREVKMFVSFGANQLAVGLNTVNQYGWSSTAGLDEEAFITLIRRVGEIIGPQNLKVPDLRVDLLSDEVLLAIKRYATGYVAFGVESGSQRMLNRMRKGTTVEKVVEAVGRARRVGLKVIGAFIVGHPEEGEEDYAKSRDLVEELSLDEVYVNIATPIPGTKMAEEVMGLPLEKNPLYIKDEGKLGKLHDLTVAEARALDLALAGLTAAPSPHPLTEKTYERLLRGVRIQSVDARLFTGLIKSLSRAN